MSRIAHPPQIFDRPRLRGRFHQVAFFVTIPAGIVLVALGPHASAKTAAVVFSATLAAMFGTSAALHRRDWPERARRTMRRLDHSVIYLLIAGTFTAFAIVALRGTMATVLFAVVWIGAIVGIVLKLFLFDRLAWLGAALYIVLGWAAVPAAPQIVSNVGLAATILLFSGGVLYTVGAVVLFTRRPDPVPAVFGYHEVWHSMVIGASLCHYAMFVLIFTSL